MPGEEPVTLYPVRQCRLLTDAESAVILILVLKILPDVVQISRAKISLRIPEVS